MHSEFIAIALLLTLALGGLDTNLLVVLFKSSEILARLRELTSAHNESYANKP